MFNERKVAQIAAYFLQREGGSMAILKLMKLLYLAERESLKRYGMPMTGDRLVSMDHGPVLSNALNLANGTSIDSVEDGWDSWIPPRQRYDVVLEKKVFDDDFDELSKADINILEHIWAEFGDFDKWKIRDYTHTLPEWKDPQGTSLPIAYKDVFLALGYEEEQACQLSREIEKEKDIDRILQSL